MKLRSQISFLLTTLIVLAIGATAGILIFQSRAEISEEIYTNARNYGELTAERMVDLAKSYLPSQSFVLFNPQMQDLIRKNNDVSLIQIYRFNGELIYDSKAEANEQYLGSKREGQSNMNEFLARIQNQLPSVATQSKAASQTNFIKKDKNGNYSYVNTQSKPLGVNPAFNNLEAQNLVFPVNNEYAVYYELSYGNLLARLQQSAVNIGIVAAAAILISIMFGLLFAGTLTRPLRKLTIAVSLIAKGDLDQRVKIKSHDEVGQLAIAVNQMAADLKQGIEARVFKEKTEKEIELAAKIQQALLPKEIPDFPEIDIAATLQPAAKVSGDVYDVLEINNDKGHYLYAYLGDVTGHGISASLLSTTANAMIAMLAPEEPDPVKLLSKVNRILKGKTTGTVFITLALIKYDFKKDKLSYVNAGHEQLIRFAKKDNKAELEPAGGIAMAMVPDIAEQLEEREIDLANGDALVIYSDGIPEAWKNEKDIFSLDALVDSVSQNASLQTASAAAKAIIKNVNDFRGNFEQKDDITLLICKKG